jgi:Ca2+-binding EF-hand superfamily protein
MKILLYALPIVSAALAWSEPASAGQPIPGQNSRPGLANLSADNFIRRFDKNGDGVLSKDEVPPSIAQRFEQLDTNGDGKLDKQEIEAFLKRLRQRLATNKNAKPVAQGITVDIILKRFDMNHDGKISREEAKGPLAKNFDRIDTNKDGYLDRKELQKFLANRLAGQQGKGKADSQARQPARPAVPDFDALDSDADGRLSRKELAGTPLADAFEEMDTNKDGKIDRKEFEAYFQKQADKKAPADKK